MKPILKFQKSLCMPFFGSAALAIAISFTPSDLFAGNTSRNRNLEPPNQKALEAANGCTDSKRPDHKCKEPEYQVRFNQMLEDGKGIVTANGVDPKTFTEAIQQRITQDRKCTLTQVNLQGLKQRWFVKHRAESGVNELLNLLEQCPKLTHLNLEGLTLKAQDFVIIAEMSSLKYLNLRNTNLTSNIFKDTLGGTGTKLANLRSLLIKPSKDKQVVRDVHYPRDFQHLPNVKFFDGSIKDGFGTLAQLDNLGSAFSQTHKGFGHLPPDLATKFTNESKHRPFGYAATLRRALATVGKGILEHTSDEGSEEATRLLKEETKWGTTPEPDARHYDHIGKLLIDSHPDVAHSAFDKAMHLSREQKFGAEYSNVERDDYKKSYYHSLFRWGLALYKNREAVAKSPQDLKRIADEAIAYIHEAKRNDAPDAERWLKHVDDREVNPKQDQEAGLNSTEFTYSKMKAPESVKDLNSTMNYIKQRYIDPMLGCDLQSVDLTDIPSRASRKVKLSDLLSLLRHECKGLKELTLGNTRLSDQDVREISQMDQLRTLRFNGISVTSSQLKEIGQMDRLEKLALVYPNNKRNHANEAHFKRHILTMRGLKDLEVTNALRPGAVTPEELGNIRLRESSVSR